MQGADREWSGGGRFSPLRTSVFAFEDEEVGFPGEDEPYPLALAQGAGELPAAGGVFVQDFFQLVGVQRAGEDAGFECVDAVVPHGRFSTGVVVAVGRRQDPAGFSANVQPGLREARQTVSRM